MDLISVNIPHEDIELLELLVMKKKFPNRSEAIRKAVRELIKREFLIDNAINSLLIYHNIRSDKKKEKELIKNHV